ncbi:hypothetical protein [Arsenicitalea aurantiaca]|nr:hypothetical protein [Arsenicitalea aurantiaca]
MTKSRNFFARAFDAVVDARTRQAERYVANYMRDHDLVERPKTNRE